MPDLDDPQILAEGVKPDAAIEFWQHRAKLTWDQAKDLADGAKARAFYVTGLYQQDMVNLVSDALKEALENGETLEDFKARISEVIKSQQWHERKIENIFRTNMQTAYMAGRYKKMQEVKAFRPYWQYVAVMDKRVRPNHAVLHGLVYPADHEFWDSNFPPNGFRCRCTVITLSERQVKKKGLTVQSDMPGPTMWTDPKTGMEYHVNFPGAEVRGKKAGTLPEPLLTALTGINPTHDEENCKACVLAFERRRRGDSAFAKATQYIPGPGNKKRVKKTPPLLQGFIDYKVHGLNASGERITKKMLYSALDLLPNGARAIIYWVAPGLKSGHAIVWEKIDGQGFFMDPQTGRHGDAVVRKADPDNGYYWFQTDTLNIKDNKSYPWNDILKLEQP